MQEEYPGVGFRDSIGGREAYLIGHRVGVWEVADVYRITKTIKKTAQHFRWHPVLARRAIALAQGFPGKVEQDRRAEDRNRTRKPSGLGD